MFKLFLLAMAMVGLALFATYTIWRVSGAASLDAVRSLVRTACNLYRSMFDREAEASRRALVRRYTESTVTLALFSGPLDAGFILSEGRTNALEGVSKARHELQSILRALADERAREPALTQLAEHIAYDHLLSPSEKSVADVRAFLLAEVDLLSDSPHSIDGHSDRLMRKFFSATA